jgi:hypothetical protein
MPSFIFENEPFFGHDRIDLLIWQHGSQRANPPCESNRILCGTTKDAAGTMRPA